MPGDRIRITSRVLYRNGAAVAEPYAVHKLLFAVPFAENFPVDLASPQAQAELGRMPTGTDMLQTQVLNGEVVVPSSRYFVLGDNRENSLGSRYWAFLDSADIIEKALFIYDSETPNNRVGKPPRWQARRMEPNLQNSVGNFEPSRLQRVPLPGRRSIRAGQHHHITIWITQPALPMIGTAISIRRIPMLRQYNLSP